LQEGRPIANGICYLYLHEGCPIAKGNWYLNWVLYCAPHIPRGSRQILAGILAEW
jgi:hypothetical protein